MLRAEKRLFIPTYHFFNDENYIGTLQASSFRPKATFIAKEGNYTFYREKFLEGKFYGKIHSDRKVFAEKPKGILNSYFIKHRTTSYFLKPGELFYEKFAFHFEIFEEDEFLGSIDENPTKFMLKIDLEKEVKPFLQCFIFWLAYLYWSGTRGWSWGPVGRIAN